MEIYNDSDTNLLLDASYNAKRLLDDSLVRTLQGYHTICEGSVLSGSAHILLARIESAVAFTFVAISGACITAADLIMAPVVIIPLASLNLISRVFPALPFSKDFPQYSSDIIYRMLKINLVAIPAISLFLFASGVNTFLPGILRPDSGILKAIHYLVEDLGPLQRIRAIVPDVIQVVGSDHYLSVLEAPEEYFRSLSSQNYLKEVSVSHLRHYYSYRVRY